ncbi:hypothetical protein [Roseateles violae]|uniref:Uncharacterized protein n=1 Tax=Roseateles violae TaxID=3058042 RepID=A0ABT8DTR6_9BURK|nr:hypothetical protein [Pelomonas sp. PFR6]MDN3921471.1 hypothetical protein [Pelomonas sp. PFR6]
MNKQKPGKQSISTEETREAVTARRYDVAGVFQPDASDVAQLLEQFDSVDYVGLVDFFQLVMRCERQMIDKLEQLESAYTTGISIEGARALLLSLLRIPPVQRAIDQKADDREQTEEEMAMLRQEVRAAAKIAYTVARAIEKDGAPPSLETVDRLIRAAGADPKGIRAQLESARAGDPPMTFNDNQELPIVLPMPKCLLSENRYTVDIMIDGLSDKRHDFEATVIKVSGDDEGALALQGLIDVPVRATFVPDKRGKIRRALLGAQLTNKSVTVMVEVTRGFRGLDGKHNALTVIRLNGNPELASAMEQEVSQLKLDFVS